MMINHPGKHLLVSAFERQQDDAVFEVTKKSSQKRHLLVQHNYSDRSQDPPEEHSSSDTVLLQRLLNDRTYLQENHTKVLIPFPVKLFAMLELIEADGLGDVVSWQPHGRCFVVRKPAAFSTGVLPTFFPGTNKWTSFQRQLNIYGFTRLSKGKDQGGYYHEYFLRGHSHLVKHVHRIKCKGTGSRPKSNPDAEPNFYAMSPIELKHPAVTTPRRNSQLVSRSCVVTPTPKALNDDDEPFFHSHDAGNDCFHSRSENEIRQGQQPASNEDRVLSSFGLPFYSLPTENEQSAHVYDNRAEEDIDFDRDSFESGDDLDDLIVDILLR
jgi:HSF-type DNA-binding